MTADVDALKPGWRLMWSIWHYFEDGASKCGKFQMSPTQGVRRTTPRKLDLTREERGKWQVCPTCDEATRPVLREVMAVGDVISVRGTSVPKVYEGRLWRVEAVDEKGATLQILPVGAQ